MAMSVINSSGNINIPHGISAWFKKDWTGGFLELGDMVIDGVALSPEFVDFESVRAGIRAIRKRILTNRAASVSATLNEPSIVNFQRLLYGGDITSAQAVTLQEGRPITVQDDTNGTFIDLGSLEGNERWSNIIVTGIFEGSDVLEGTEVAPTNAVPDTNGYIYFSETDIVAGDTVYVKYTISKAGLYKTEIFGSSEATIEGEMQIQARNQNGGVLQVWDLASVQLAPNGDITYPIDAVQTLPMLITLQERGGTFGDIYAA